MSGVRAPRRKAVVVGFGKMGQLHLSTLTAMSSVDVIGIVDIDPARRSLAERAGLAFAAQPRDLPTSADIAVVATPPETHRDVVVPLLEAGVHCLVEKPLALKLDDIEAMSAAATATGAVLAIGQTERFNVNIEHCARMLENGPGTVTASRISPLMPGSTRPDVIADLLIHDLDWIVRVEGHADCQVRVLEAKVRDGMLGSLRCHLDYGQRQYDLEACHSGAGRSRTVHVAIPGRETKRFDLTALPPAPGADPLSRQAQSFLDLCEGKAALIAVARDARRVFRLSERIRGLCAIPAPATED
jgi:predicted dehydrogenase